jgi:hypothetical protein
MRDRLWRIFIFGGIDDVGWHSNNTGEGEVQLASMRKESRQYQPHQCSAGRRAVVASGEDSSGENFEE